jgi:hypothetical protein
MITPSKTYLRFKQSESYREKIAALLDDETVKLALEAVASCASPTAMPQHVPGQAYDITIAHAFHEMRGVNEAIKLLKGLGATHAPGQFEAEIEEEFAHALSPEFQ